MQSHTKSVRYTGVCLVRCPGGVVTGGDGVLTSGLLCLMGDVCGLLVTVASSPRSPDGAPPRGVFALQDTQPVPEVVALGLALEAVDALPRMEAAFPASPSFLPTARPPHTRCCLPPGL